MLYYGLLRSKDGKILNITPRFIWYHLYQIIQQLKLSKNLSSYKENSLHSFGKLVLKGKDECAHSS